MLEKFQIFGKNKNGNDIINKLLNSNIDESKIKALLGDEPRRGTYIYDKYQIAYFPSGPEVDNSTFIFKVNNVEVKASNNIKGELYVKLDELYKEFNSQVNKYNL